MFNHVYRAASKVLGNNLENMIFDLDLCKKYVCSKIFVEHRSMTFFPSDFFLAYHLMTFYLFTQ